MARRAWQDTTFGFCSLLMVYVACEIGRRPRAKPLYVVLFAGGAFSLLTKESSVLAYGLVLIWLAGSALLERSGSRLAAVVAAGAGSVTLALGVWVALAGDVRLAIASVNHSTRSGAGAWAQQYCSGRWYQFPYLLWIVGPLTAAAALAGAAVALTISQPSVSNHAAVADRRAAGLVAFVTLSFVAFASFYPNLQYLRIISPAGGTYCLLGGLGLWFTLSTMRGSLAFGRPAQHAAAAALAAAVLIAGINDYQSFTSVVVHSGMEELSVFGIRSLMNR
jgi:hypothetical protein